MTSCRCGRLAATLALALALALACLLAHSAAVASPEDAPPTPTGAAGSWKGSILFGPVTLLIVFHFEQKDDGTWGGTMDSPDQGVLGLPLTSVTVDGSSVTATMLSLNLRLQGTISADGQAIEATFQQHGMTLPLKLERATGPIGRPRPQEPKPPYPYRIEELTAQNAGAGVTLAGTLTLPEGTGPFPAAVLVSGSGPQDRDEALFGHKPFHVLADHLTRRGIAVYRYDDRGVGGSTGSLELATTEDFAGDAIAAVEALAARPDIDGARVGIIGHSEGGLIGPMAATRSDRVAFVVMMAGPGLPGDEILSLQSVALLRAMGESEEHIETFRKKHRALIDIVKGAKDPEAVKEEAAAAMRELIDVATEGKGGEADAATATMIEEQTAMLLSPWFRGFLTYDPRPTLATMTCPVLALIGEKDLQVPPAQNIPALEAAFAGGNHPSATVREMPGLNHLFQQCETGLVTEYGAIEETMSPSVLDLVATWILETGAPAR